DLQRVVGKGCQASFDASGTGLLHPQVVLHFVDGSTQTYGESFAVEKTAPTISFDGVSLSTLEGKQNLVVTVHAQDDTDISQVRFSVAGLRASDLRAAGGIVDAAKKQAFAATDGVARVFPITDSQASFSVSIPLPTPLTAAEIAHDGVVLSDV